MKKLLIATTCLMLAACTNTKEGAELYGDTNGGWSEVVDVTNLTETALTKEMRKTGRDVVYFRVNESAVDADARADLQAQAEWLKAHPQALVVIEGRCDERGTREYNLALGDKRANAARSYLIAKGVEPNRIQTISYGKDKPVVLGSDEAAWAKNRSATTVAY
ncbi:MAG: peptidoglycan-associated lipoprotein Pal [Alphaproteobacteria bacterium]|nr:peptidoglycan-associated lipoprotein Pal [Alphaproteobacteria bacterium]